MNDDDKGAAMPALVIAILGAESTGKTTLACALAERLRSDTGLRAACVGEHLRDWCARQGRTPQRHEQAAIAQAQDDAIDAALAEHDIVVADTTSLMTAIYSRLIFNDDSLIAPAAAAMRSVQLSLVTALDLPWVADGFQRDGPQVQTPVLAILRNVLMEHQLPWAIVRGVGAQRLESALDAVAPLVRALPAPRRGLFTRLDDRNATAGARTWRCERCDDPDCEHALRR